MAQTDRPVVLVPVTGPQATRLHDDGRLNGPLRGFTADALLCATFDLESGSEEAEFAAFQVASVAALVGPGPRLVLVARPRTAVPAGDDDAQNGAVDLGELALREVEAYFVDDQDLGAVADLSRQLTGRGIDESWELPAVQALLAEHPLAWHDASELAAQLTSGAADPTTRIVLDDHDEAVALAHAIEEAGHEVVVVTERAGDDEGAESYLVATPASRAELGALLPERP